MDIIIDYMSAHPAAITLIVILVVIFLLYLILKQLIKFFLVVLFVLMAVGGFYYFKDSDKTAEKIKNSVDTIQAGTDEIADKCKNFYRDTKDLFNRAKKVPGEINALLEDSDEKAGK